MSKLVLPSTVANNTTINVLTKEKVEERLKKLETEKANIVGALASYDGAIQDCQYWLKELTNDRQSGASEHSVIPK